jgi:hypothetical protein
MTTVTPADLHTDQIVADIQAHYRAHGRVAAHPNAERLPPGV